MGKVTSGKIEDIFNEKTFNTEKEMCNYIEENIEIFCKDTLEINYISHERESYLARGRKFSGNKPHVDFLIKSNNEDYVIVECKNPRYVYRENIGALSQILDYIRIAENNGYKIKEAWICTSRIKRELCEVIDRFKLPINICVLNKKNNAIRKVGE